MRAKNTWRVLLNESKENKSRIIFSGHKHQSLIDITMQSEKADIIINTVLSSNWNAEQLMTFLNLESQKIG